MEKQVFTVEEVAARLRIGRGTAYDAVRRGEIPVIRIGRRLLVPRAALARMLAAATDHDNKALGVSREATAIEGGHS